MGYGITHTAEMPVVGVTPRTEWAELLVDAIDELRTTLDAKVTPAGIDINANLSFRSGATYYAATNLKYIELALNTGNLSAGTYPGIVYKGTSGNLYFNNDAGDQVQLSSGASVAGAAGNIAGTGYGTGGVEVTWVAADAAYEFRRATADGTDDYAHLVLDSLKLNDGDTNFITITSAAIAADYTLTLPTAVPATNSNVLTMSTTGAVSTATAVSVASVAASGAITAGTTITATGNVITSGLFTHAGVRVLSIPAASGQADGSDETWLDYGLTGVTITAGTNRLLIPIVLPVGAVITDISFYLDPAGTGNKVLGLYSLDEAGTSTLLETRTVTSSSTSDYTLTVDPDITVTAGSSYMATFINGDTNDLIRHIEVSYYQT